MHLLKGWHHVEFTWPRFSGDPMSIAVAHPSIQSEPSLLPLRPGWYADASNPASYAFGRVGVCPLSDRPAVWIGQASIYNVATVTSMRETYTVHSTGELVEVIGNLAARRPTLPLWYRGQRDASWSVAPALWRRGERRRYSEADERNFTHRFRTRAAIRYQSTPDYDDASAWLSLMQHYGLPTRLLDWSRSPLVAAYFALESYLESPESEPRDAAIWVLSPHELNRRQGGSGVTPAIGSGDCAHLVDPAFRDERRNGHSAERADVIAAMATELDMRMFVQQGCFTVHAPHSEPLEDNLLTEDILWRLLVPRDVVGTFAREMDMLGFRGGDLFPDLQNLAKELTRTYPAGSVTAMKH